MTRTTLLIVLSISALGGPALATPQAIESYKQSQDLKPVPAPKSFDSPAASDTVHNSQTTQVPETVATPASITHAANSGFRKPEPPRALAAKEAWRCFVKGSFQACTFLDKTEKSFKLQEPPAPVFWYSLSGEYVPNGPPVPQEAEKSQSQPEEHYIQYAPSNITVVEQPSLLSMVACTVLCPQMWYGSGYRYYGSYGYRPYYGGRSRFRH